MTLSFENYSILGGNKNAGDSIQPYSFIKWLEYYPSSTNDVNETFKQYQNYILDWSNYKNLTPKNTYNAIRDSYINLLKEIALNFSTEEEKRFITNADYTDAKDLDIIIPFFVSKLKAICLVYSKKREAIKNTKNELLTKGSIKSIKQAVKKFIHDLYENQQVFLNDGTSYLPILPDIPNSFDVTIDELYDKTNYYNISPDDFSSFENTSTDRKELSSFNINDIDPTLFLNFKQSIINAINQYPFLLKNIQNAFSVNLNLSGTESQYLKNRDFINYVNNFPEDLKLHFTKFLSTKYSGNNFYYLSTNSTGVDYVSGSLFSVYPLSGSVTLNLLNRKYPTTATVPNLSSLYTVYEIGRFFVPSKKGLLLYNTKIKSFKVDKNKLDKDKVYIFPDPENVGNIADNSGLEDLEYPLTYEVDVRWGRMGRENQFKFGHVLSNSYEHHFYPYQSYAQDIQKYNTGVSRSTDKINFWEGENDSEWSNSDIWEGIENRDNYDYDSRYDSLLIDSSKAISLMTDFYGNQFSLYKVYDSKDTIYYKKKLKPGRVLIRKFLSNKIENILDAFSNIFVSLDKDVFDDLHAGILTMFVVKTFLVLETSRHVVFLDYNYVSETDKFNIIKKNIFSIKKSTLNSSLEIFLNPWYNEDDGKLYLGFTKLLPSLSSSNYKALYPYILMYDSNISNLTQVYPDSTTDTLIYSLSNQTGNIDEIDVVKIDGGRFSYSSLPKIFSFNYFAKNENEVPFIYKENLMYSSGKLKSTYPILFKPKIYVYDANYSNITSTASVKYRSDFSNIVASKAFNLLKFDFKGGQQYYFANGIDPVVLNSTGNYNIQFDWSAYSQLPIFIGCTPYYIISIEDSLYWFYDIKNLTSYKLISSYNEKVFIDEFNYNGNNFKVYADRPVYPQTDVLNIEIVNTDSISYSGSLCDNIYSIFKKLKIVRVGDGKGIVTSDPPCINCGTECELLMPLGSQILISASAAYDSKFVGWIGNPCDNVLEDCIVTIMDNTTISAYFYKIPEYSLTIDSYGGQVITLDGIINCPVMACSASYFEKTPITLSAAPPRDGFLYLGWRGGQCNNLNSEICSFVIEKDNFIYPYYLPDHYHDLFINSRTFRFEQYNNLILTVNSALGEKSLLVNKQIKPGKYSDKELILNNMPQDKFGTVQFVNSGFCPDECYFPVLTTTLVNLKAIPSQDYIFDKWLGYPIDGRLDNEVYFRMMNNFSVTALFIPKNTEVVVYFASGGVGRVYDLNNKIDATSYIGGKTSAFFASGGDFTFYFAPCAGNALVRVETSENETFYTSPITFDIPSTYYSITAFFEPINTFTVTLSTSGRPGHVESYP